VEALRLREKGERRTVSQDADVGKPLIRRLLPATVTVVEGPVSDETDGLWSDEAALVSRAVAKRRREFSTGRRFAHVALEMLGCPPAPLRMREDHSPAWPRGIVGSIAHTDDYCAVAVARSENVTGLGIDIERISRFTPQISAEFLTMRELVFDATENQRRRWATHFAAKEAFYKCVAPAGVLPSFLDCAVEVEGDSEVLSVELLVALGPFPQGERFSGRYAADGDLVAAAVALPSSSFA